MDKIRTGRGRSSSGLERFAWRLRQAIGKALRSRPDGERGQGLAEYALILALIAVVCIAALAFFGLQISAVLTDPVNAQMSGVLDHINP
jgi:Flp pilus assembly pilin Flp